MTTWGQGSTRGSRRARATALERDNYECQLRINGCTNQAATTITTSGNHQSTTCPHCLEHHGDYKQQRKPRKQTTR